MSKVPTASITTNRTLKPEDEAMVRKLAADIKKNGLREPLILREDLRLIDGLRRLEAVKLLGWDGVESVTTDDLYEVIDRLKTIHGRGVKNRIPLSDQRAYELYAALAELSRVRGRRLKQAGTWLLDSRPKDERRSDFREAASEALGLPYTGYMSRVVKVFRLAAIGDELAIQLRARVDAGELTSIQAYAILESSRQNDGDVTDPKDQLRIIDTSIRGIAVTVKALKKIKRPTNLSPEEITVLVERLRVQRGALTSIIGALSKEIKNPND